MLKTGQVFHHKLSINEASYPAVSFFTTVSVTVKIHTQELNYYVLENSLHHSLFYEVGLIRPIFLGQWSLTMEWCSDRAGLFILHWSIGHLIWGWVTHFSHMLIHRKQ